MAFLIKLFLGWGLPDWLSKLLGFALPVLLVIGALWYYGHTRYEAGQADEKASWEAALKKAEDALVAAENKATAESVDRQVEFAGRVAEEKEKIDDARQNGDSTFDALFGTE